MRHRNLFTMELSLQPEARRKQQRCFAILQREGERVPSPGPLSSPSALDESPGTSGYCQITMGSPVPAWLSSSILKAEKAPINCFFSPAQLSPSIWHMLRTLSFQNPWFVTGRSVPHLPVRAGKASCSVLCCSLCGGLISVEDVGLSFWLPAEALGGWE